MQIAQGGDVLRAVPPGVLAAFGFDPGVSRLRVLGEGHIHETFEVRTDTSRAVIQRVNSLVFPDPKALGRNTERIGAHLSRHPGEVDVPSPIRAVSGDLWWADSDGEIWRAYCFVEGAHSCPDRPTSEQAFEVGRAFGDFLGRLADMHLDVLEPTIDRFHDLPSRLDDLDRALAADRHGRAAQMAGESRDLVERASGLEADVPRMRHRVVHNDTKVDNVMLEDETGRAHSILDLDTVMPGWAAYDAGDCIRSALTGWVTSEGENPYRAATLFAAVADGFVVGGRGTIDPDEVRSFVVGALTMSLELAARFFTDHLSNDAYFRVSLPGENLLRGRVQMGVLRSLLQARPRLVEIAEGLAARISS